MMGQRDFLIRFFEQFHQAHDTLIEICTFTRDELFRDNYLAETLSVGLPHEFESAIEQSEL